MALTKATYSMILGSPVNAFDFMTPTQIADVQAGTLQQDVTSALQAWLDAVGTGSFEGGQTGTRAGYLPAGIYKITSPLIFRSNSKIYGVPWNSTIRPAASMTTYAVDIRAGVLMDGIVIDGQDTDDCIGLMCGPASAEPAICNHFEVNNCFFGNFTSTGSYGIAVWMRRVVGGTFNNTWFYGSRFGVDMYNADDLGYNTLSTFNRCTFRNNTIGANIRNAHGIDFQDCGFEGNEENSIYINTFYFPGSIPIDGITVNGGWLEDNWAKYASNPITRRTKFDIENIGGYKVCVRDLYVSNGPNSPKTINNTSGSRDYLIDNININYLSAYGTIQNDAGSTGIIANWDKNKTYGGATGYVSEPTSTNNRIDIQGTKGKIDTTNLTLTCATPGDLSVSYAVNGRRMWYQIIDNVVKVFFNVTATPTFTTASGAVRLTGLPLTASLNGVESCVGTMSFRGVTKATYTQFMPRIVWGTDYIDIVASGQGLLAIASVTMADLSTGNTVTFDGYIEYIID